MSLLLASGLVSFEKLLPFAIFGLFAACAWLVLDRVARGQSRASERLDEIKNPGARKRAELTSTKKQDAMSKVLEKATPALAKSLQPKTEMEVSKLKAKLANGGFRSEAAPSIFLSMKFVGLIAGLVIGGGAILGVGVTQKSLMYAILLAGGLFYLPELALMLLIRSRKQSIFLGLPDALDLMVVCVEAGLGLDQAMRKVAEEMKKTFRVIADEFALSNLQLQMGRPRATVLHELGIRTGVDDVRALAAILIQADKFGSSIAQALRVQSDSMRTRRRQLAEEKAAKTAVKLIFPLVLFIFPGIFVVLVGPAAITMVRDMFPKMGGG
jgi:tight adherence protein C